MNDGFANHDRRVAEADAAAATIRPDGTPARDAVADLRRAMREAGHETGLIQMAEEVCESFDTEGTLSRARDLHELLYNLGVVSEGVE